MCRIFGSLENFRTNPDRFGQKIGHVLHVILDRSIIAPTNLNLGPNSDEFNYKLELNFVIYNVIKSFKLTI
ncbi:hypothetical protein BpHYR1_052317 [Brachionus plicatilis]|uniref:Uncharacterized protein n=1 Tax=Brachionus plicatilis TaxID=10195 RepID=A0A3M7T340_BRAPC|nr:hypothetical protein BpHYR1_052317 [Brachionus plicatilis]